ncbi:GPI inositol-deacylase [Pseudomonas chlororaphis]|uniref:esterase/lipase family protein n=1 Tax=Pseudomonas chlororaphis TaxID=587753 RepID=UPI00215B4758|nr:GPI inositol-deacylase [Pseudomonas chlororaphis]UVE43745.1 GPI inositol-deacylase [Pseudomonas chlororaphis]
MSSEANTQEVIVPRARDNLGRPIYTSQLTRTEDQRDKVLLVKQQVTIPVIFIPGIMGTNLRNKKTLNSVWSPPNASFSFGDIAGALGALFVWGFRGPKRRQELLKADDVEVDDRGTVDPGASGLSEEAARMRGWGKVMRTSYNPIMALLESRLDHIVKQRELQGWWQAESLRSPSDYGEELGSAAPLSSEELTAAGKYQFDIWCGGYNWLQSNRQSGQDVRDYIENTVLPFYREKGGVDPEQLARTKVILVTHSMGGLVARSLTQLHGYERVLGVVHGVLPALGSSAIYHHVRCGYEGAPQIVLGANAGEVTAVVANSPGALELAPSAEYRGGRPWLFLCDAQGQIMKDINGKPRAYPQHGDPYEEIYKSSAWYGLVPEQNVKYLDMSEIVKRKIPREEFDQRIDDVFTFHSDLAAAGYHPETYAHYGADDSSDRHSWRDMIWQGDSTSLESSGSTVKDNENGSYNGWFRRGLPSVVEGPLRSAMSQESFGSGGDGTVPTDSGLAPGKAGIKASFRQGSKGVGQYNTDKGYEHQKSYNDKRAQWATFYGVIKIAQNADWAGGS